MSNPQHRTGANCPAFRLFVCTGDVSGDLHGALLCESLRDRACHEGLTLTIEAVGGPRMKQAGALVHENSVQLGAVGLWERLVAWRSGRPLVRRLVQRCITEPMDLAVLIDFPGVNVPLAKSLAGASSLPVFYYIPPHDWIWSTKGNRLVHRTVAINEVTTRVLAVLRREADYYSSIGCQVDMVGHPLRESVRRKRIGYAAARRRLGLADSDLVCALLPASRKSELREIWPIIGEAAARLVRQQPGLRFLLPIPTAALAMPLRQAAASTQARHVELEGRLQIVDLDAAAESQSLLAIEAADAAIAKTGSVSLEIALVGVPQLAVYHVSRFNELLGRFALRLTADDFQRVSLVNHIMDEDVIPEFVQAGRTRVSSGGTSPLKIAEMAAQLLDQGSAIRADVLRGYERLRARLGHPHAADRAAEIIIAWLLRQAKTEPLDSQVLARPRIE